MYDSNEIKGFVDEKSKKITTFYGLKSDFSGKKKFRRFAVRNLNLYRPLYYDFESSLQILF
jgi:hypothetical protein